MAVSFAQITGSLETLWEKDDTPGKYNLSSPREQH
jgi:hypothetical protein